jgi:hypothetical protein
LRSEGRATPHPAGQAGRFLGTVVATVAIEEFLAPENIARIVSAPANGVVV